MVRNILGEYGICGRKYSGSRYAPLRFWRGGEYGIKKCYIDCELCSAFVALTNRIDQSIGASSFSGHAEKTS